MAAKEVGSAQAFYGGSTGAELRRRIGPTNTSARLTFGADPEQRQARNNGSKFTVLSVATQRSWKNAEDEWVSKVEWHRVAIIWNLTPRQTAT